MWLVAARAVVKAGGCYSTYCTCRLEQWPGHAITALTQCVLRALKSGVIIVLTYFTASGYSS